MKLISMYAILVLLITTPIATSISKTGVVNTESKIKIDFCESYFDWGSSCQDKKCNDYCSSLYDKFSWGECVTLYGLLVSSRVSVHDSFILCMPHNLYSERRHMDIEVDDSVPMCRMDGSLCRIDGSATYVICFIFVSSRLHPPSIPKVGS
ncbi:unnamed protein product [Lactuca saligna]|uniref:Uncharacterized protein n=1 Tax=Lactuca saligna TaxID=75948 RepID=A0AA35VMC7_LACSI|nr:unnamed protein product [Lactuca saligna]